MGRQRPVASLLGMDGPSCEVPGWVSAWLEDHTDLPLQRVARRGADPGVDDVLAKLHYVAMRWRGSAAGSDVGTEPANIAEPATEFRLSLLGVSTAAGLIGISDRAVRRAIQEQRLPAQLVDGRFMIDRIDAENYKRNRAA